MNRYKINKIGLLNYWLYDEEEFNFCDGKLLLRGSNGSGKSVTMVSFFPLLFDGNKNPERFDTFGSRDRKIEDYVLPMDSDINESISYLYMEFYKKSENKYLIIGIGLKAIRNRNVDFWGFAITDNRRINDGFLLYKDKARKIPLTKRECESAIGQGGEFVTTNKDYKAMINRLLFGFENESMYTELINLMLQLRSPKLSKDYKPTRLVEILSSVLEPISDKDIEVMSSTIETMNEYKEKIDDLKEETKVIKLLKNNFYDYSNIILFNKCSNYLKSLDTLKENKDVLNELNNDLESLHNNIHKETKLLTEYKLELENKRLEESKFSNNTLNSLIDEENSFKEKLKVSLINEEKKEESINKKEEQRNNILTEIKKSEDKVYKIDKKVKEINEEVQLLISELPFRVLNNIANLDDYIKNKKDIIINIKPIIKEKEKLEEKLDDSKRKLHRLENIIDNKKEEQAKLTKNIIEESDNIINLYTKMLHNKVLTITNNTINDFSSIVHEIRSDAQVKIEKIINDIYYLKYDELIKNKNDYKISIREKEKELKILKDNLNNLSEIFENNVFESDKKNYFINNGYECKYLYELIEFKSNINKNTARNIENAMRSLGLLHTLVFLDNTNLSVKSFNNLKSVNDSLLKYFNIVDSKYENEVKNILSSISSIKKDTFITEDGTYQMGILGGCKNDSYESIFIGSDIRKKFLSKEEKIIKDKILIIEHEIDNYYGFVNNINDNLSILEKEKNIKIDFKKYQDYIIALRKIDFEIQEIRNNIIEEDELEKKYTNSINELIIKLEMIKFDYQGQFNSDYILKIEHDLNNLSYKYSDFKTFELILNEQKENLLSYKLNLEIVENDLDDLRVELTTIMAQVNHYKLSISKIIEQINQDKYKGIKEKLEIIKSRIKYLEDEIINKEKLLTSLNKDIEINSDTIKVINAKIIEEEIVTKCLYDVFMMEYNLGYSSYKEELRDIKSWFRGFKLEKNKALNDANDNFNDRINEYLFKLQNYAGKKVYRFDNLEDNVSSYTSDEKIQEKLKEILINAKRTDLEFRYKNGTLYNILELSDALTMNLEETEDLLKESDRKLFEDLLLNNIGDSIREKIRASKIWVSEVKSIMEKMQTSSGLSFSLSWSGKNRDNEEELDTKDIVSIFEGSAQSLKDEDTQKIIKHFRSKIKLEEEKYEDNDRNYINIIRDVLDYRKWFSFKLFYRKGNSLKKELTDKEFSKFSGGEKAIGMYVPLFAGINAKFNSARNDSPRIIALDEAFAGVDDMNIEDCFRILESLDLDYILTSQILWGDYKTIKSLAINELHHLQNSNVVSILRYKWDGCKKVLVTKESEYEN